MVIRPTRFKGAAKIYFGSLGGSAAVAVALDINALGGESYGLSQA